MIELKTYNEKIFLVPVEWLVRKVNTIYATNIEGFLNQYTWDDSEILFELAKVDGLVNC